MSIQSHTEEPSDGKIRAISRVAGIMERIGFPITIVLILLLGGGYIMWRSGIWLSDTIITPLVKQHLQFVETTEKVMTTQSQVLVDLRESMDQLKETNKEVVVLQREMTGVQRDVAKTLDVQNRLLERLASQERRVDRALDRNEKATDKEEK